MTRPDYVIEPKVVTITNPGINYGVNAAPLRLWAGEVESWEPRWAFGKPRAVPWRKVYTCRATDETMARQLLARQAQRDGYALGGVQNIHVEE